MSDKARPAGSPLRLRLPLSVFKNFTNKQWREFEHTLIPIFKVTYIKSNNLGTSSAN